jgi:hypothetical protein
MARSLNPAVASMTSNFMGSMTSNFIGDAVIGSLPRGMGEDERLRVFMNTPLSPMRSAMQEMPQVQCVAVEQSVVQ